MIPSDVHNVPGSDRVSRRLLAEFAKNIYYSTQAGLFGLEAIALSV
jgi:hypothetical protein